MPGRRGISASSTMLRSSSCLAACMRCKKLGFSLEEIWIGQPICVTCQSTTRQAVPAVLWGAHRAKVGTQHALQGGRA